MLIPKNLVVHGGLTLTSSGRVAFIKKKKYATIKRKKQKGGKLGPGPFI